MSAEYKRHRSDLFTRIAPSYDRVGPRFFTHFGQGLVEFAGILPGATVLDVACGKGACLFPASVAIASAGYVVGADFAEGMLAELLREMSRARLVNAGVALMDAEELGFRDASFDHVLCGLALMFLANVNQALVGILRVLKPGGRFTASTFEVDAIAAMIRPLLHGYREHIRPIPQAADRPNLDNSSAVRQALAQAGFTDTQTRLDERTFYVSDEEEWWGFLWSMGYRALLERIEEGVVEDFKRDMYAHVASHKSDQGIPVTLRVSYMRGTKP